MVENDTIISVKEKVAEKLNDNFVEMVDDLDIEHYAMNDSDTIFPVKIQKIVNKLFLHPSVIKIKEMV